MELQSCLFAKSLSYCCMRSPVNMLHTVQCDNCIFSRAVLKRAGTASPCQSTCSSCVSGRSSAGLSRSIAPSGSLRPRSSPKPSSSPTVGCFLVIFSSLPHTEKIKYGIKINKYRLCGLTGSCCAFRLGTALTIVLFRAV